MYFWHLSCHFLYDLHDCFVCLFIYFIFANIRLIFLLWLYTWFEMGAKKWGRLQQVVCYRDGAETGGLDLEDRREGWRATCFSGYSVLWIVKECLLELGTVIKWCLVGRNRGKDRCDPLEVRVGGEARLEQAICYRAGVWSGDLIRRRRSAVSLPVSLPCETGVFPGDACWY